MRSKRKIIATIHHIPVHAAVKPRRILISTYTASFTASFFMEVTSHQRDSACAINGVSDAQP
jgi:hypothetical protein